jgi:hypothetical protein
VNSVRRLQEMKAFLRMSSGHELERCGWNGDGTQVDDEAQLLAATPGIIQDKSGELSFAEWNCRAGQNNVINHPGFPRGREKLRRLASARVPTRRTRVSAPPHVPADLTWPGKKPGCRAARVARFRGPGCPYRSGVAGRFSAPDPAAFPATGRASPPYAESRTKR